MKDFAGNEINEAAMTQAIAAIDWSSTEGDNRMKIEWGYCVGCEAHRWLILDDKGVWQGCRHSYEEAVRFIDLRQPYPCD